MLNSYISQMSKYIANNSWVKVEKLLFFFIFCLLNFAKEKESKNASEWEWNLHGILIWFFVVVVAGEQVILCGWCKRRRKLSQTSANSLFLTQISQQRRWLGRYRKMLAGIRVVRGPDWIWQNQGEFFFFWILYNLFTVF